MEALIVILSILLLAAIIAIHYYIASEFYLAAIRKGYNEKKYFWIPFLFGIAGWLLIVALPVKEYPEEEYSEEEYSEEELKQKPKKQTEQEIEIIRNVAKHVDGLYIKSISNTDLKTTECSIEINGVNYSSSDWIADGKIQWFAVDNKISYGIKDKTKNAPYTLKFELVETGINVTGFPDDLYNGLYIKQ